MTWVMHQTLNAVDGVGRRFLSALAYTWHVFMMFYLSFRAGLFYSTQGLRTVFGVICAQVYFTGCQALPLISMLAFGSGAIVVLQSASQFNLLGGSNMVGQLLVMIVVREIAPLLTALFVIARSGTAVASEIGNMRVNREIEALESMGINPLSFIVFPRILGGVISVLCLALYFVYSSIFGGFVFAKLFLNMPLSYYIDAVVQVFDLDDVLLFLLKNTFSGIIIFVVCCYQGLQVKQGPHEVPQVTTNAVVHSIIYVIAFNLLVTGLFYLNRLIALGVL